MNTLYLLFLTHLVADFILQPRSIAYNKRFVNKSMVLHAGIMTLAAFIPLATYPAAKVLGFLLVVFVAHITIDASRVEINRFFRVNPEKYLFWALLGVDQILHLSILYFAFSRIVLGI